jgi:hypothetical protein
MANEEIKQEVVTTEEVSNEIYLTGSGKENLWKICNWLKFLAVLGAIYAAICFVRALIILFSMQFGAAVYHILSTVICLYPVMKIFDICSNIKETLENDNNISFEKAIENSFYLVRFGGIFLIYILSVGILTFLSH